MILILGPILSRIYLFENGLKRYALIKYLATSELLQASAVQGPTTCDVECFTIGPTEGAVGNFVRWDRQEVK